MVAEITSDEFKELIENDSRLLIVDAYATWCGPCKFSSPQFEALSKKYNEQEAKFVKVDVDKEPAVAQAFGVRSIPSFFILKGKKIVGSVIGADVKKVESQIKLALGQSEEAQLGYN